MTTTTKQAIGEYLSKLEWMIQDAKRELTDNAKAMSRLAEEAVRETDAMMADLPCSLMWVDFAEGDIRKAHETKTRLNQLLEQQKILTYLAKKD